MSAFVVSKKHIDSLVKYAVVNDTEVFIKGKGWLHFKDGNNADAFGRILWNENIKSVAYRYADEPFHKKEYKFEDCEILPAVQIIKACHCLEYQSCETKRYERTVAYKIVKAIEGTAINNVDGYEEALWEIH
jgi:hypothetical protein